MSTVFYFKQFGILQQHSSMKVGTDGVLLGAWATVSNVNRILDVGTGTGLIALMLAQRTSGQAHIDAVEPDNGAIADARENFRQCQWSNSLHLFHQSLQQFTPAHAYDLIVCNPPYFNKALTSPDRNRTMARHTTTLKHTDLADFASHWLTPRGRLAVILPVEEARQFKTTAAGKGLYAIRTTCVKTTPDKPVKRWLMEFSHIHLPEEKSELTLLESDGSRTVAYQHLTGDFYLNGKSALM
ncbi:MAG: tRNA1(Val) (adenine(37)-N6)-methyltransferase [Cyclobacteriaceae bacterium]|nr:MAG: tRNA1(Val) (adenine(37)-N6)-methyltransferase [Cyclobacteriaceae bacterium]